ncbi:MAG: OsmC family protein [archaeon]|nr:OsmC family protein [archaeon]
MKVDKSHKAGISSYIENRKKTADKAKMAGTIRIDLRHVDHLNFQGIAKEGGNFTVEIDEPPERDGHGKGPTPLNYFLIGAGSCLLMQWAKLAVIEDLDINNLEAIVRGHTDRRIDGYFTDFVFDITMTGNESEERIKQVAKESERLCFVHNTLKRAVPVITNVMLNDKVVYTSKLGPKETISA